MKPMNYNVLIATNLMSHKVSPGDMLTLTLRNEDSNDGMFSQAKRLSDMFLQCYNFYPEYIAIHPDHLTLIRKLGKTIDVTIPESISEALGKLITLTDLPRRIPLVEDDSLDLFTAVARYHFRKESAGDFLRSALEYTLGTELR